MHATQHIFRNRGRHRNKLDEKHGQRPYNIRPPRDDDPTTAPGLTASVSYQNNLKYGQAETIIPAALGISVFYRVQRGDSKSLAAVVLYRHGVTFVIWYIDRMG